MRISVINSDDDCPKVLPSLLRHSKLSASLVQEDKAEMVRRDTHNLDVVSQPRRELQHHHLQTARQSDEFQQSHRVLRQKCERSSAERAQLRNQCEETRTSNDAESRVSIRRTLGQMIFVFKNSDYRRLDEHQKSGIVAAIADVTLRTRNRIH